MVYVISKEGKPLMPSSRFGKIRRLLKEKKAKVIKRCPFTIKLLYDTTGYTQEVVLGQDTGSKYIGTACVANNKVMYQSQTELRIDIKDKMTERLGHRRFRRTKLRYRKPRFKNRANSTRKDRLPPSVRHKVQSHIDEIEFCKKILPISKIVLEVSQFDTHLMKNPSLLNENMKHWAYQKGINYGFACRKSAILHRDNYSCQLCNKKNTRLEVHHIIYRSNGGTDDENNLITLCEDCHKHIHIGKIKLNKQPKRMTLKFATHMNIIRSQLLKYYPNAIETYGFVTKANREQLSLPKDHYIDAVVIASGGCAVQLNNNVFYKKRVAKQNRAMQKGVRGEKAIPLGKINGFRKYDKVKYFNKEYFIKGRRTAGTCVLSDIHGNSIHFGHMPRGKKIPKLSNCLKISSRGSCLCTTKKYDAIPVLS